MDLPQSSRSPAGNHQTLTKQPMSPREAALLQKAQRMNAGEWSHHCPELAPRTLSFSEIYLTHE